MLKKVSVKNLKVGHYVEKLDQSWFTTPFLFHRFKINSQKDIQKLIDNNIQEVFINTKKGLDIGDADLIKEPKGEPTEYIIIDADSLIVDTVIPFNLYQREGGTHTLYLKSNIPLHPEILYDIKEHNIEEFYVDAKEGVFLNEYYNKVRKEKGLSKKGLAKNFETAEKVKLYNNYLNNYMPISPAVLIPGLKIPFPLFVEQNLRISKISEADDIFDPLKLKVNSSDYKKANFLIGVEKKDIEKYKMFLKELAAKKLKPAVHAAVIKENTKIVAKDLLDNPRSGEHIKVAKESVNNMLQAILDNPTSFYGLMRINAHDYYTYVHSVNVSTISIGIGMSMGLKNAHDLKDLAFGSLLHDVGKSIVDSRLINKPGKLTDAEFKVMKDHVLLGEKVLKKYHKDIPEHIYYPLLQHHEKLSGTGYPKGLKGEEIHAFGRISAIADIYDALTTERAYKKALTPFDALNYLAKHTEDYDQKIFKHFVLMLGKQEKVF